MDDTDEGFDAITLEILWSRLISIADEAAAALLRTAFSTIVRESNDFATVLMDANGDSVSENTAVTASFHRGRLVGFAGSIAHSPDVGGALWSADCREVFEEGIRIPPLRLL